MKLEDFYPHVVPHVSDLPLPMIELQVRTAACRFFTRTLAWQVEHDPITATADTISYDIDVPTGTELVKLKRLRSDGERDLMERAALTEGQQLVFHWGEPQPGDIIQATLVVAPAINTIGSAWQIPDRFKPYCEDIAFGALASLLKSGDYRQQFNQRISTVSVKVVREFAGGRMRRARRWSPI